MDLLINRREIRSGGEVLIYSFNRREGNENGKFSTRAASSLFKFLSDENGSKRLQCRFVDVWPSLKYLGAVE